MVRLSLAPCALLLTATLATSHVVSAQTAPAVPAQRVPHVLPTKPVPVVNVNVIVPPEGEVKLSLQLYNTHVSDVISQIAVRGNLEIVVQADADVEIKSLMVPTTTAVDALRKVCEATHLQCENQNGVWVVSRLQAPGKDVPDFIDAMEFKDTDVKDALAIIAQQFKVQVALGHDVTGKVAYLRLVHKTPREAIDLISMATGLNVAQAKDGTLVVSKPVVAE